jgi:hypothetical protein
MPPRSRSRSSVAATAAAEESALAIVDPAAKKNKKDKKDKKDKKANKEEKSQKKQALLAQLQAIGDDDSSDSAAVDAASRSSDVAPLNLPERVDAVSVELMNSMLTSLNSLVVSVSDINKGITDVRREVQSQKLQGRLFWTRSRP